jgi:predicted nucleic acid-binding protein
LGQEKDGKITMPPILIDTNVLLYVHDPNSPEKQARAREVVASLGPDLGCLSAQNLAEFVSASMRKLQPPLTGAQAYEQATLFAEVWSVFDVTQQIVLEAARGVRDHQLSYYDAQIWASARLNQVPVIFSEDFQDGQSLEGVRFVNPFALNFDIRQWI